MPDEPGKPPDGETGEQPPPPDELPGDRRTDGSAEDVDTDSAKAVGDILDESDLPDALSKVRKSDLKQELEDIRKARAKAEAAAALAAEAAIGEGPPPGQSHEIEPFEPPEEMVFHDGFESGDTRAWSAGKLLKSSKGKTAIIGGTALLGVAAYFIFLDVIPAQDQAIEQSAGDVIAPPEQGDAASEVAPGAAVDEQPLGQADEVEDLPPAEESEESVAVIEPQGPIVFTMDLFGGTCSEYASEYSQTVELTAHPAPGAPGLVIVMMVNPESGQAVQSAPWDPLSNDPVVMVSQGETSERYGVDPETRTFEYVFTDQDGQACPYFVDIPDTEESDTIDIFFLDLA